MAISFTVQTRINKSLKEVFKAVVDPKKLSKYFVDSSSGPITQGAELVWSWTKQGDIPVTVKKYVENETITMEWQAADGDYKTQFKMDFLDIGSHKTLLKIEESGWKDTPAGIKASHDNCDGWRHMSMCLKAYLEHGVDLRI